MCKRGDIRTLEILDAAVGKRAGRSRKVAIDNCLYWLVKCLNDAGISTASSCCGHGEEPGYIELRDGRTLFIASKKEAAMIRDLFSRVVSEPRPSLGALLAEADEPQKTIELLAKNGLDPAASPDERLGYNVK
jgi:hypothetical protein